MKTSSQSNTRPLEERERAALLKLLGDDDPEVFNAVQERILAQGPAVCEWLRPHRLSSDPSLRRNARRIIQHFERRTADHEFLSFCLRSGEKLDIETGSLLLARTTYPDVNAEAYHALLDDFAAGIRPRLASDLSPREQLARINDHLFNELGFRGNEENYFDPRNSHLNQVLDRRTGNPISLSIVYLLIARRLQLPVSGIGLPGHFVCRYQSSADSVYIDAFNRGRLLTKADCVQYLLQSAFGLNEQFLTPMSARRMLMRVCGNLHRAYLQRDDNDEANRMQGYLVALSGQTLDQV
ncbi:MAG TPA: transglutaminase-like domain-containing protein [Verrucomicrobiae bacterium]|nr:transglutaminase-like domain-containing protein [Verrucomicrobiae bacterium]